MAISANRFQMLDEETNVAVTDFRQLSDNNVLNRAAADVLEMTAELNALLNNFVNGLEGKIKSLLDDLLSRLSIDGLGDLLSNLGIDVRAIKQFIDTLLGIWDNLNELGDILKRLKDIDFLGLFINAALESFEDIMSAIAETQSNSACGGVGGEAEPTSAQKSAATAVLASAAVCGYKPGLATLLANLLPEGMVSDFINKLFNIANRMGLFAPLMDILENDLTRMLLNGRSPHDVTQVLLRNLREEDVRDPNTAKTLNHGLREGFKRYDENWDKRVANFQDFRNGDPIYFDFASVRNRGYQVEGSSWRTVTYATTTPYRDNENAIVMNQAVVEDLSPFTSGSTDEQVLSVGLVNKDKPIDSLINQELLGYNP